MAKLCSLANGAVPAASFPNSHLFRTVVGPVQVTHEPASWAAPKAGTALAELREAIMDEDWAKNYSEGLTKFHMRAEWAASDERRSFLQWLLFSTQARRVLEIGSFCGLGTLTLAESLPEGGRVDALELDPFVVRFGERFQRKSACGDRIHHHVGQAKASIERLAAEAKFTEHFKAFDVVIVDADKEGMREYFDLLWQTPGLLSKGAVVCVDMTPFKGQPPLRYLKFGFPFRCETSSGQEQIDALRSFVKASPDFSAHEFGGLLIVQQKS